MLSTSHSFTKWKYECLPKTKQQQQQQHMIHTSAMPGLEKELKKM
jgi:hypothetical protein